MVLLLVSLMLAVGLPGGSDGKESSCNAGDPGSIPGSGRSPGEENGYPLQYSCLKNAMDGEPGRLWVTVHGVSKSQTQLSYQQHLMLAVSFLYQLDKGHIELRKFLSIPHLPRIHLLKIMDLC